MGISEWGIQVSCKKDLENLLQVITEHNAGQYGEKLHIASIIRHNRNTYACLTNDGGRYLTSEFLSKRIKKVIYMPFLKPVWWESCQDYVWKAANSEDVMPLNILDRAHL